MSEQLLLTGDEAYAHEISDDLANVTFTMADRDAENMVFSGPRDELETIVRRYITPIERANAREYVTQDEVDNDPELSEDFEYFSNFWPDGVPTPV